MSKDIHLAFAHPSERAAATAPASPRDRISLRDHIVEVDIGAFQSERGAMQRVQFNVVVEIQPHVGPLDDDVDRILSYDAITEAIATELAAERLNLLETLAERVADRILLEPLATRVFVRVEKLDRGPGALGVEIVRSRMQVPLRTAAADDNTAVPHPLVVYLSNDAIASDHLNDWLDALQASGRPVVLCVGASDQKPPQSDIPAVQRRIDLLAIEQNAWILAGRDKRCVVVGTRTELDWGMKNGQISVWAPSKIVLDAVDGTSASAREPKVLVAWFASQVNAEEMICLDTEDAVSAAVPVRQIDPASAIIF